MVRIKKKVLMFLNVIALFVIMCSSIAVFAADWDDPVDLEGPDCSYIEKSEICPDEAHTHYWCEDGGHQSCEHQNCP